MHHRSLSFVSTVQITSFFWSKSNCHIHFFCINDMYLYQSHNVQWVLKCIYYKRKKFFSPLSVIEPLFKKINSLGDMDRTFWWTCTTQWYCPHEWFVVTIHSYSTWPLSSIHSQTNSYKIFLCFFFVCAVTELFN